MIGLLLVTHGDIGKELLQTLEYIVGPQQKIAAIAINPDDNIEKQRNNILKTTVELDNGAGVVILTDILGGTPSNLAVSIIKQKNIKLIAGVNLPMLIKLVSIRNKKTLEKTTREALKAGQKYINVSE